MLYYAEQPQNCRMAVLRSALGDLKPEKCKNCDICTQESIKIDFQTLKLSEIRKWLDERPITIAPIKKLNVSAGISILDAKLRSPLFVHLMKQRSACAEGKGMNGELVERLKRYTTYLAEQNKLSAIVPIPSRTWQARDRVAAFLANHLDVPVLNHFLFWSEIPQKRQGELHNNDQRHHNIHMKMRADPQIPLPSGITILLDDYIGSGNTIKEAAKAIREIKKFPNEIVPLTIAKVKWHLGKPGFN